MINCMHNNLGCIDPKQTHTPRNFVTEYYTKTIEIYKCCSEQSQPRTTPPVELVYPIEFNKPSKRSFGESCVKFLDQSSDLYKFLIDLRTNLLNAGYKMTDIVGLHVKIVELETETLDTFLSRVSKIQGSMINVTDLTNYYVLNNSVVIRVGFLEGYGKETCIIIATVESHKKHDAFMYISNYIETRAMLK